MKYVLISVDDCDLPEGVTDLAELSDLPKEAGCPGKTEGTCTLKVREDHLLDVELYLSRKNISFTVEWY